MIHSAGAHELELALRHPRILAGIAALLALFAASQAWWRWDEAARTATAPRVATVASLAAARERVEGDWAAVSDARLVPGLVVHRDQGDDHVATDAAGTPILVRLDADEAAAPRIEGLTTWLGPSGFLERLRADGLGAVPATGVVVEVKVGTTPADARREAYLFAGLAVFLLGAGPLFVAATRVRSPARPGAETGAAPRAAAAPREAPRTRDVRLVGLVYVALGIGLAGWARHLDQRVLGWLGIAGGSGTVLFAGPLARRLREASAPARPAAPAETRSPRLHELQPVDRWLTRRPEAAARPDPDAPPG